MKIVIAGGGKVGGALVRELSAEGHELTVIDNNEEVLQALMNRFDVMTIQGNCAAMDELEEAGIKNADLLVAATGEDEINLLSCMSSHVINPNLLTIARIRNPEYHRPIYRIREMAGLSLVVNPDQQMAIEIQRFLHFPAFLKREHFARDRAEIVEIEVSEDSRICNRCLIDLYKIVKCKVLVCIVQRGDMTFVPDGQFVLHAHDRIFVTAPTNNLTILMKNLGIIQKRLRNVMICGGGRNSYYLGRLLIRGNINVKIIEKDRKRCLALADLLPEADIVEGDASDPDLLEEEGMSEMDAIVGMTGLDELNIIIAMYAKDQVPQIITKIGHIPVRDILKTLPIGRVINVKELCAATIVNYIHSLNQKAGSAKAIHPLAEGKAMAAEFHVTPGMRYEGIPLKELPLKKNILVACIIRRGVIEIPGGDSFLQGGDSAIIVSNTSEMVENLGDIFRR